MHVGTLPDGTHGFDANTPVTLEQGRAFYNAAYRFVVRYVPRTIRHDNDITAKELVTLLMAGLAVMIVQHFPGENWLANAQLGFQFGNRAVSECESIGLPPGVTVWCDLESVSTRCSASDIIGHCNAWHDQVKAAGYEPGLYVGYGAGLSAMQLYKELRFKRYWRAYNLNSDRVPAVRGVQMRQTEYPSPSARVRGIPFQYDGDVIEADAMGDSPTLLIP